MKVALIGVGNMGSALVKAWLRGGTVSSANLTLFDTDPTKLGEFKFSPEEKDVKVRISVAEVVVLAIKPQDLESASKSLQEVISPRAIILSILAGVSLKRLSSCFPKNSKIVRAMPNMGARICKSITGYVVSDTVDGIDSASVSKLLRALGPAELLKSEELMDPWCAVAGSGPGFVVSLMEAFVAAAIKQGFSPELANTMVIQTFYGTAALLHESQISLANLRETVSSKGGTTAAGLSVLNDRKVHEIIADTVEAAKKRGIELNKGA